MTTFACLWPIMLIANLATAAIENYENFLNDIDLADEDAEAWTRNAVLTPFQRWPGHTLHYKISPEYTPAETANVRLALRGLEESTCLRFVEMQGATNQRRFVHFTKAPDKCGTMVGYNPLTPAGEHAVVLNPNCLTRPGIVQHETLHVLGLYHEQSRPDRDQYVKIVYENIPPQFRSQFARQPLTTTLRIPYDHKSIMHYSQFAFAKDPSKPTMLARGDADGEWVERPMGQTDGPSKGDFAKINILYNCQQPAEK